jgi:hypothetical protein
VKSFFAELKRRKVHRVAIAYAVAAWLLIQIATQVFPFFEIPNWAVRLVVLRVGAGFSNRTHPVVDIRSDSAGNQAHRGKRQKFGRVAGRPRRNPQYSGKKHRRSSVRKFE